MKKLSKEKRQQVVLAVIMVLVVVGGLWSFLIRYQLGLLEQLANKKTVSDSKRAQVVEIIKTAKAIEADLQVVNSKLADQEQLMASGDLYSSMVSLVRKFKQDYSVEIPQFSAGAEIPVDMIPRFPYKQFTLTVAGTGTYFEIGQFIAEFENHFPTARIHNLNLTHASSSGPDDADKLSFRMDIVSLVSPQRKAL